MSTPDHLILVTGPARSGKSEWAELLASRSGKSVTYIATAQVDTADREWQARIEQHRRRRPAHWTTQHVPVQLADAIALAPASTCLVVDSLGTWLVNCLEQTAEQWQQTSTTLCTSLARAKCDVILVAEETGWGVVPAYPSGRMFRDRLGALVRRVSAIANPVYLVTSGYILNLTELGFPLPTRSENSSLEIREELQDS